MTFLIGDGVVPSNEDRGYILRRVMRRAIQQGERLGIEGAFLPQFAEQVIELMGPAYPEGWSSEAQSILKWVRAEEEGFQAHTRAGHKLLDDLLAAGEVGGAEAFTLRPVHFPIELTREIAAEHRCAVHGRRGVRAPDERAAHPLGEAAASSKRWAGPRRSCASWRPSPRRSPAARG